MTSSKNWRNINLFGATEIARVCGVYEITEMQYIPGTKFKIKVLERAKEDFIAIPNVSFRISDNTVDGMAGLGRTEEEALEDALRWFMEELMKRTDWSPNDFEWDDPIEF